MNKPIDISAIVPVGARYDKTGALAEQYLKALTHSGRRFELIYVLDGQRDQLASELLELSENYPMLRIFQLSRSFGEATALTAGFEYATGAEILTLPAYYQVDPPEIVTLVKELDESDMAIAVRWPRAVASKFEEIRRNLFHRLVQFIAGERFLDLGCNVRLMRRKVIEEVLLYGEQHRFLPLLASRKGFRVREVRLRQSSEDRFEGRYGPKVYFQRLLDIFTVFFLTRFTKKPLRFFGMIGGVTTLIGGVFLFYLVIERLFFGVGLAGRPALLLSSLLVVLGLQLFSLGLLGELIIFTHARDIKEYTIEKVVN
jgi:glycosyltransferase involved in cell wall biosynthesis